MRLTFDGEHRCGKGTQVELCVSRVQDPVVVRGDGSYQGGLDGIATPEEIAFRETVNKTLYDASSNQEYVWGLAATACAATVRSESLRGRNLLIDRGPLSRASFLLSKGFVGRQLLNAMYPKIDTVINNTRVDIPAIDVRDIDFGSIVYLQVPTEVLMERVSDDDPKAAFRRNNILSKEGLFEKAIDALPKEVQENIVVVNGNLTPSNVLEQYAHLL